MIYDSPHTDPDAIALAHVQVAGRLDAQGAGPEREYAVVTREVHGAMISDAGGPTWHAGVDLGPAHVYCGWAWDVGRNCPDPG